MKYVLITGAGGGLGYSTADSLAKKGYYVIATDINIDIYKDDKRDNIKPITMDVTSDKSVVKAYNIVRKITPKIDAIINFAGISLFGSLIESKMENMERVMNVNLFGTVRVNKIFFDLLKEKRGRIINISSENGWQAPSPFNGIYSMSKYALEAYNDSLRRELNFLGLKVIKIQPGSFKSNMHDAVRKQYQNFKETTKLYPKIVKNMGKMMEKELQSTNDIKYLLDAIYDALENNNPKLNYRVKNSKSLNFISRVPDKVADNLFLNSLK